jgi:hypothetical protein
LLPGALFPLLSRNRNSTGEFTNKLGLWGTDVVKSKLTVLLAIFFSAGVAGVKADADNESLSSVDQAFSMDDELFSQVGLGEDSSYDEKLLLGGNRKFIVQHDYAYVLSNPKGVGSNRSSLRFQWNRVWDEKIYFHVDIKPIVYWSGDDSVKQEDSVPDIDLKTKELYVKGSFADTTIVAGNKIVVWGESDSTAVTDVISPQNITDLVFTSVDESRISQTMVVVEHYLEKNQFTLIVNPDIKVDEGPVIASIGDAPEIEKKLDEKSAEIGLRWKTVIGNGDFSLMAADLIDNGGVDIYRIDAAGELNIANEFYKKYQMLGAAANLNYGDLAVKVEAAYNRDRAQQLKSEKVYYLGHPKGYGLSDEGLLAVNVDYQENGIRDWSAGILHTYLRDGSESFELDKASYNEIFLGVSNKFFHEEMTLGFNYQYTLETKAAIAQLSVQYNLYDDLTLDFNLFDLDDLEGGSFNQTSAIVRVIYSF